MNRICRVRRPRRTEKVVSLFLSICMLLSLTAGLNFSAYADEFPNSGSCGANVSYVFDSSTGKITISGTGKMTDYNASSFISNMGISPFNGQTQIKSVEIENGVTSVGSNTFALCTGITSVSLANSITSIGERAFASCTGITEISIPSSMTSIGKYVFLYCSGLHSVYIPKTVKSIGDWAFSGCSALKNVYFLGTKEEWQKVSVGSHNEAITNATVVCMDGVFVDDVKTAVVEFSVYDAGFIMEPTALTVSADLSDSYAEEIGYNDSKSELTVLDAIIAAHISLYGTDFMESKPFTVSSPYGYAMITSAFGKSTSAIGYRINGAFANGLDDIVAANNYVEFAFYTDTIGYSDTYTFFNTRSAEADFDNSVNLTLKKEYYDSDWNTVVAPAGNATVTVNGEPYGTTDENGKITITFNECGTYKISAENKIGEIPIFAPWCIVTVNCAHMYSVSVVRQPTCTEYGSRTYTCVICGAVKTEVIDKLEHNFRTVITPPTLTQQGYTTYTCTKCRYTYTDNYIEPIYSGKCGDDVFYYYDSTTETLTISGTGNIYDYESYEEYESPDKSPFLESSVKKVIIENGVTSIGDYSFCYCRDLESAEFPDSIKSIGKYAFEGCTGLTNIEIPNGVESIGEGAFWYCSGIESLEIPDSVSIIGESAFHDCTGLKSVIIGKGLKTIGRIIFSCCENLTSIAIPRSVVYIEEGAFNSCPIETVYYSGTKEEWKEIFIEDRNKNLILANINYSPCEHNWEIKTKEEATCIASGRQVSECSICGAQKADVIPLGEHTFVSEKHDATPNAQGYTKYTCPICNYAYVSDITPYASDAGTLEAVIAEAHYYSKSKFSAEQIQFIIDKAESKRELSETNAPQAEYDYAVGEILTAIYSVDELATYKASGIDGDIVTAENDNGEETEISFEDNINEYSAPLDVVKDGIVNAKDFAWLIKNSQ